MRVLYQSQAGKHTSAPKPSLIDEFKLLQARCWEECILRPYPECGWEGLWSRETCQETETMEMMGEAQPKWFLMDLVLDAS